MGFDEDAGGEAEQRGGVGEDPDDVGAAFDWQGAATEAAFCQCCSMGQLQVLLSAV